MKISKVIEKETNNVLFSGSLMECQAFLKGMYAADLSDDSLWFKCFIKS